MKLTKLTLMAAVATAAGFCMSVNAGEGQSGTLELTAPTTNVNVTASSFANGTYGTWNEAPTDTEVKNETTYIVIDNDASSSNVFTATTAASGDVVKCNFKMLAAPVPESAFPASVDSGAQVAFCIHTNTTAKFKAYVGGAWHELTGATIPATDSEYTLTITFDYKNGKYAKFSVGDNDLNESGNYWFATGKNVTSVSEYCFVGSGDVASFVTTVQNVKAEEATIGEKTYGIPEEVIANVGGGSATAAATELAKTGSNGKSNLDNYIIYGLDSSGNIKQEAKPVAKAATKVVDNKIKLNFTNVAGNEVSGTSISYQLKGKVNAGDSWSNVGSAVSDKDLLAIPVDTSYRFFTIDVTVTK